MEEYCFWKLPTAASPNRGHKRGNEKRNSTKCFCTRFLDVSYSIFPLDRAGNKYKTLHNEKLPTKPHMFTFYDVML